LKLLKRTCRVVSGDRFPPNSWSRSQLSVTFWKETDLFQNG